MNPVFSQVCERILKKECAPFLGSGVSASADYSGDSTSFARRKGHTVNGMKKMLRKRQPDWRSKTLGQLCEETLWAEGIPQEIALKRIVDKLEIREFTHFIPTPAHTCIALLAREGLFPQIFTTNYDTALEKAFVNSFGSEWESNRDQRVSVVHDQLTCTHQRKGQQGSGEILHLYKINGCADALARANDSENYSSKILLTMTQLQSWRERRWAKDTFRVALRSNTILFSGFGSDEPQIIHTVHQILDEYSSLAGGDNSKIVPNFRNLPPNAPVIQSYEPTPHFCQLQIVNNYTQSYFGKYNQDFATELILTKKKIDPSAEDGDELPADDFWSRIYWEVQKRIVNEILKDASAGQLAISALPKSRYVFWGPVKEKAERLFEFYKKEDLQWQTSLSHWLSQLLVNGAEYVPLRFNRNLVAELLWLFWATKADLGTLVILADSAKGNLLSIRQEDGKEDGKEFLLLARRDRESKYHKPKNTGGSAMCAFCLTASFSSDASIPRVFRLSRSVNGKRSIKRAYTFTLKDIVQVMNREGIHKEKQHREIIEGILACPSRYGAHQRKTKRQRYGMEDGS